ncbi:MAG: hypothetical protein PHW02_08455 [bacterium]|nr:hypothetical protein [bacterium]
MKKVAIFLAFFILISIFAYSQDMKSFYFSPNEENMLMIRVNIWGYVHNPNSVLIPDGTDLVTALSYAGGPSESANVNHVVILHADGTKTKCDIAKFKGEGSREHNPVMRPGDTVMIKGNFLYHFTNFVTKVYQVAVVASVLVTIYNAFSAE